MQLIIVQEELLFTLLINTIKRDTITWKGGCPTRYSKTRLLDISISFCQLLLSIAVVVMLQENNLKQLEPGYKYK